MTETLEKSEMVDEKTQVASEEVRREEVSTEERKESLDKEDAKKEIEKSEQSDKEKEEIEEGNVVAETDEDDDEIEWSQSAPKAEQTKDEKSEASPEKETSVQLQELQKRNEFLEAENKRLMADPLVNAYSAYLQSSDEPNLSEFLSQVGAISYDPTQGLSGDELVRKRYEKEAQAAGLSGDDLNYAVEEEMQTYENATTLGKRNLERQAKEFLSAKTTSAKTVEQLQEEFIEKTKKRNESDIKWLESNYKMSVDFINKAVAKGKYNGRTVDSKWGEKIKAALGKSNDIFLADFVRYTDPDKEGVRNLFVPDVVDYLDFALHREDFKKLTKKRVDKANAESLEEKAKAAHQTAIETEKATSKSKDSDIGWYIAFESYNGKRHPKDPRGAKQS